MTRTRKQNSCCETDKRRFDTADKDKDGALSKDEFVHFMHPESSPEMGDVHVLETIEGKLRSV